MRARLVELIQLLDHDVDREGRPQELTALDEAGETAALVATLDKKVVGLVGIHPMVTIHRDAPVGRITVLVVAEDARGHGIGRMLVEAAENGCREAGCEMVEVTSNDRRAAAHAFYRHMGYERTSIRFFKKL